MEPNAFVAEVYRRMSLRHQVERRHPSFADMANDAQVLQAIFEYAPLLPAQKDAPILDVGFGSGWFIAACLKLGYSNIAGADFLVANKDHVRTWRPDFVTLHEIEQDIGSFLAGCPEQYAFIHMSHVIEHIPKYSLLWVVDSLYRALKPGGMLYLRTPNMEGPAANSSYYVTLAHEYGFSASNLQSLLDICGFDDIKFHSAPARNSTLKRRIGRLVREPFLLENRVRHRLFGANFSGQFGAELAVTGVRNSWPPFFDPKYR